MTDEMRDLMSAYKALDSAKSEIYLPDNEIIKRMLYLSNSNDAVWQAKREFGMKFIRSQMRKLAEAAESEKEEYTAILGDEY